AGTHIDAGRTRAAFERRVTFSALVLGVANRPRFSTADAFGRGHRIRRSLRHRGTAEPEDVSLAHWLILRTVVLLLVVIHGSPPGRCAASAVPPCIGTGRYTRCQTFQRSNRPGCVEGDHHALVLLAGV